MLVYILGNYQLWLIFFRKVAAWSCVGLNLSDSSMQAINYVKILRGNIFVRGQRLASHST